MRVAIAQSMRAIPCTAAEIQRAPRNGLDEVEALQHAIADLPREHRGFIVGLRRAIEGSTNLGLGKSVLVAHRAISRSAASKRSTSSARCAADREMRRRALP